MQMSVMVAVYIAQNLLSILLIERCLHRWTLTAPHAGKIRKCWLIPFALLSLLPVTGALLPDGPVKYALQAAGNVWLGFYVYFGGMLSVLLLLSLIMKKLSRGRLANGWHGGILCLSLFVSLMLFGYGLHHAQQTVVVSYDLDVDKPAATQGETMDLVLIGDLHLSVNSRLSTTRKMVELINAEHPDAVVIAGDIFTSSYGGLAHPEQYAEALRGIEAQYGVYAVYGNHDVEEPLLGGFPLTPISKAFRNQHMEQFFDDCGFITLADEMVTLPNGVQLAGRVDGEKAGDGTANRLSAEELLKDIDPCKPVMVLQHEPKEFEALGEAGADIALCGHTHAGQIFPGNLIVPFFNENAWGYRRLYDLDTFVTAGVGYYGPPMRVGTDSEVTVIHMKFQ